MRIFELLFWTPISFLVFKFEAFDHPWEHDIVLVIVNDHKSGGAGGSIAITNAGIAAHLVAIHEVGHAFAFLGDEYLNGGGIECTSESSSYAHYPNIDLDPNGSKWGLWLDLPHIGAFEGAAYCKKGAYRPTEDSMMKRTGQPFWEVNSEAIIWNIWETIPMYSNLSPASDNVLMGKQTFSVETEQTLEKTVSVGWYVDGVLQSTKNTFTFEPVLTSIIEVKVVDNTRQVRKGVDIYMTKSMTYIVCPESGCGCWIDFDGYSSTAEHFFRYVTSMSEINFVIDDDGTVAVRRFTQAPNCVATFYTETNFNGESISYIGDDTNLDSPFRDGIKSFTIKPMNTLASKLIKKNCFF